MTTNITSTTQPRAILRWVLKMAAMLVIYGIILFLAAGRINWGAGWAYLALTGFTQVLSAVLLIPIRPDLLAERSKMQDNTKPWDRVLAPLVAMVGPLLWMIIAGLDARFGWSEVSVGLWAAGLVIGLACSAFVLWAMISNPFFAATVRIQDDRGHTVTKSGPYKIIRHPGYAGAVIFDLAAPLALRSWWAYIPVALTIAAIIYRTTLEDRTLQAELPGYANYAKQTRYRLLPGIW
jgi:protein-S-isoprenylcysteine O-methyltransferase Ste14